jgi:transposase
MTCWRRLRDWQRSGIWDFIDFAMLDWLARFGKIDWSRSVVDGSSVRAVFGGAETGPQSYRPGQARQQASPDLRRTRSSVGIQLTRANRNDSQQALALVDAIPSLQGPHGRPRQRPSCVLGDRGYDAQAIRQGLRIRRIVPLLAMRNTEHGSGLGRWRWVVERTFARLNQFRRLRIPYEKRTDIHEAFLSLGCALICWRLPRRPPHN